ncbi:parB-like partition protein [Gottschalkia acidurici 9a]|uniref:ParB-like partition protein n=1 Tax=Gottschalkia acidurici (strain ATCC 7906 / DSM 604 / BCRC 14475 / CIP 104303 / KCTC 5404 / NCIMB 10678 / 9a) TaxID=1128398 RepID=K0B3A6_GOTA9|nr:ParB/RepB/Spo0J family partition protein [Gottschalkia acidurici]AFS79909.1 parB-like partition protein [Gottschalkia acidurici 9a]
MNIKDEVVYLDIYSISPNKDQPRKKFDKEAIDSLSDSIKNHGVIQPIIVRQKENGYEIIAGERRWRAARVSGLTKIPSIVKNIEELEVAQIALVENIQRENLNPIEEGLAFKELIDQHKLTQEKIGKLLGKSRPYVANTIRLLNLESEVIDLLMNEEITSGHGRAILGLKDIKKQVMLARLIVEKDLSVRETEKLVKELNCEKEKVYSLKEIDPVISDIEQALRESLGTKVQIVKGKNKGKIEIEYYSDEELDRIIELISK